MKHLKLFENTEQYLSWKDGDSFALPNVCFITEDNEPIYNPLIEDTLICTYNVTTPGDTLICNSITNIQSIIIDGILIKPTKKYNFKKVGNHTVKFVLIDKTSIPQSLFDSCPQLVSAIIPNSVTSIDRYTFEDCTGLTLVTIGNSVTNINGYIFRGCSNLKSIICKATNAPVLNLYALDGCSSGGLLTIPREATGYEAWMQTTGYYLGRYGWVCVEEKDYVIENDVYYSVDGKKALYASTTISGILNIKQGVETIGYNAFYSCRELTEINIPDSVTKIEYQAFMNCFRATSITIPNSVTSIDFKAFSSCSGFTSINIPNSITSIEKGTFSNCSKLTSVTIPATVTNIGYEAFGYCSALKSIICRATTAPPLGSYAFTSVAENGILTIPVEATGYDEWMSTTSFRLGKYNWICIEEGAVLENGIYYSADGKKVVCASKTVSGTVNIKQGVEIINDKAFVNCISLISVTMPDSVVTIGNYAFSKCSNLISASISDSVTTIGNYAFNECQKLSNLTIGNSVLTIGEYAFYGCKKVTSTVLPSSVTTIGDLAFNGCSLQSIVCRMMIAPTITRYVFANAAQNGLLTVPVGATGYDTWMKPDYFYLGYYNWTIKYVE